MGHEILNCRIWTLIKEPDFRLEPQAQLLVNIVRKHQPLSRGEVVKLATPVLETVQAVTKVVTYWQIMLVRFGIIRVETPGEYDRRIEKEQHEQNS